MMKKIILNISIMVMVLFAGVATIPPSTVAADDCPGKTFIFPRWYENLCKTSSGETTIMSPAEMGGKNGQTKTADDTAANFSKWIGVIAMNIVVMIMTVVGYVSLGFIIWGGFKYMISGDSSSGTVAARKTIQNAIIGLVLSIMSVSIINFIAGAVVK